jgi:hypothetical protein
MSCTGDSPSTIAIDGSNPAYHADGVLLVLFHGLTIVFYAVQKRASTVDASDA